MNKFKRYSSERIYGWIAPDDEFIPTSSFGHITEIWNNDKMRQSIPEFNQWYESVEDAEAQCQELEDIGEHGEWHHAEMERDDFISKIRMTLYSRGWIRVGSWNREIHFEGTGDTLSSKMQLLKDFAEDRGMGHVFERIKV